MPEFNWTEEIETTKTAPDFLRKVLHDVEEACEKGVEINNVVVLYYVVTDKGDSPVGNIMMKGSYAIPVILCLYEELGFIIHKYLKEIREETGKLIDD